MPPPGRGCPTLANVPDSTKVRWKAKSCIWNAISPDINSTGSKWTASKLGSLGSRASGTQSPLTSTQQAASGPQASLEVLEV
eukprot:CAMPEP_0172783610 /NCGR_PEP_ID=MMETSP1074-20121228/204521_1 /TAXON_ID=2916 /ORGANISM="Ceratium fusus, Strain PA161109" /LENGTH=81 /DNA_ID=CAMNT_0013620601 /DNA_START=348 /DNA_END=593 /DNA_ORIENTATION=+